MYEFRDANNRVEVHVYQSEKIFFSPKLWYGAIVTAFAIIQTKISKFLICTTLAI